MANKTTLSKDIKTVWTDGCKGLVSWLQSFGKPKLPLDGIVVKHAVTKKPKRARGKKGRYLADDPTTKHINEAWVGGKKPKAGRKKKK
tara:strand:+ start:3589 stop:3852 length:264 start_codon:yes stop_codon:yes gene_type:complete